MKKSLLAGLTIASILLVRFPAYAAPALPETLGFKSRIDKYVDYMNSSETWMEVPVNSPADTFPLPKGLFKYVDTWVGVFQRERYGSIPLSEMAVGYPGSTDSTRGEGVNGFYTYCGKYRDLLLKVQALAGRAVTASASDQASAEQQKELSEISRSAAATAMNVMTIDVAPGNINIAVNGNATCAKALADIYYSFSRPLGGYSSACIGNVLSDPARDPANSSGVCVFRNRNSLNIATLPDCTAGSACNASVTTSCTSASGCHWYDFRSTRARLDANIQGYERAVTELENRLKKVEDAVGKASQSAADAATKLRAETLSRGSVISLPLPLSNISVAGAIGRVINALLGVVGAVALLMFVWGGAQWMLAAGNQEQVGKAKKTITWAALGLIAIFSSYAVLNFIIQAFSK